MIKLNFNMEIYDDEDNSKTIKVTEELKGTLTLQEALHQVYKKYSIRKDFKGGWYIIEFTKTLWSQYFSSDIYNNLLNTREEYVNTTLDEYEKQFNISNLVFDMVIDPCGMGGIVGQLNGITYFFHTNESDLHHRPHIHTEYQGIECRIRLDNLEVMDKPYKSKKIKEAIHWIERNKKDLLNYWNKVIVNGESIKFKMKFTEEETDEYIFDDEEDNRLGDSLNGN